MIHVNQLTKHYRMGDQVIHALDGVSLEVHKGEFVAIMGSSGSGKSTLMNIIGCLDTPSGGSYLLNDQEISGLDDEALARVRNLHIGFVFQNFNLLPRMSALENVALPLLYAGVKASDRRPLAVEALKSVGLEARMHHKPMELSGGQQQRVAIARAIVNHPHLLLADEPTGALDTKTSEEIMDLFLRLNAQGMTVVLVTHEPDIASFAQCVVRLRDGKIISDERVAR